ncbi:MAG: transcriptional regulator [Nitrososphaeraceae archaeon]
MLLPFEIESKAIIPAIRAILALKLIEEYDMREDDVAKAVGITQAAVSNYARCTRGNRKVMERLSSTREIMRIVEDIAADLAQSRIYTPHTMLKFIEICNLIRSTLIICEVHHEMESDIDETVCEECKVNVLNTKSV